MLPKKSRLSEEKDFKKILSKGKSFFSPAFSLRYLTNNLNLSRVGVVVSTKVSKKSTIRNRLKRQVRAIIRLNLANFKPGYDLAIYLKSPALDKDYHQLEKELLSGLIRIKLLK